jgi:hypothetical protein
MVLDVEVQLRPDGVSVWDCFHNKRIWVQESAVVIFYTDRHANDDTIFVFDWLREHARACEQDCWYEFVFSGPNWLMDLANGKIDASGSVDCYGFRTAKMSFEELLDAILGS